jgi:DNA-binding IclR family transcriptional regulator
MTTRPDYRIDVVDRALDLLEALRAVGPASLSDLAARVKCTRTAAFRLLRTLQQRGYAVQDEGRGVWRLGVRFPALGDAAVAQRALPVAAAPALALAAKTAGENIYLLQRNCIEAEVAALHPAPDPVRRYAELGTRLPLHAGICRLLLGYAPPALQARLLSLPLARIAPATRTDRRWVLDELARLRPRDVVVSREELFEGVVELGVPVRDAAGRICAVVAILSPAFRMRPARQKEIVETLKTQTAAIEELLKG